MKKLKLIFSILILLSLTISLTSCLSFKRDIKIYKDGSGEETLTIEFSRDFMMMLVALVSAADSTKEKNYTDSLYNDELFIQDTKTKYENMPGVTLIDITSKTNEDSSKTMMVNYLFDDVSILGSSADIQNGKFQKSETEITYEDMGDEIYFKYVYEPKKDEGTDEETDSTEVDFKESMTDIFKDNTMEFTIEFEYDVISTNATTVDGRKLTWLYDLSEIYMMEEPLVLEAVLQK